jgi:nitrite reductase (NO-forming)
MTLTNGGAIPHSIDFHAARIAPNVAFRDVAPASRSRSASRERPGVFMYHCGTKPVLAHIANGMYGAIVVDPATPLPKADHEYVLVASEWYLNGDGIASPRRSTCEGARDDARLDDVQRLREPVRHPPADREPGETTRFYVVAAGPTLDTNFHVVGTIFDRAWSNGDMTQFQQGVQTVASRRRRRGLRREDRRRGPLPLRQPRVRARRPRPGRAAEGRQTRRAR